MSFRRWSCVGAGVVALAVVISACGGGEANPLAPSQGVNEPPRVLDIVSDPATVPFGTASHVTVAEDPNGDALVYEYTAQHGHVGGQGAAVMYSNDGDETAVSDTIRVTIRDARGAITISAIGLGLGKSPPPYGENLFPRRPTPTPSPTPKPAPTPKPPKPTAHTYAHSGTTREPSSDSLDQWRRVLPSFAIHTLHGLRHRECVGSRRGLPELLVERLRQRVGEDGVVHGDGFEHVHGHSGGVRWTRGRGVGDAPGRGTERRALRRCGVPE